MPPYPTPTPKGPTPPQAKAPRAAPLHLQLIGKPCLAGPGTPAVDLERHDAAILLLVVARGDMSRTELAQTVWPESAQKAALTSLRQRLYRLRKSVGRSVLTDDAVPRLAPDITHDLGSPAHLATTAPAFELLAGCVYPPGDPLSDTVDALRQQWRERVQAALQTQAEALEAQGRLAEALVPARHLCLAEPLSDRATQRCMRLLYLLGDRGQAMALHREFTERLRAELHLPPDPETDRLARLVASAELPGRAQAPYLPAALERPPRLVGRQRLWAQLEQARQAGLPVLLMGEPGIGKSRLALDFAATLPDTLVLRPRPESAAQPWALVQALLRQAHFGPAAPPAVGAEDAAELARLAPPDWGWGPAASGRAEPARLARALAAALPHWCRQPLPALVLDDLQWADAPSLQVLLAAAEQGWRHDAQIPDDTTPPGQPWLLLTSRTLALPGPVGDWLSARQGTPQEVLCLDVPPLPESAVAEWLASLDPGATDPPPHAQDGGRRADPPAAAPPELPPERARQLFRQSGGHPFIMLEILRATSTGLGRLPHGHAGSVTPADPPHPGHAAQPDAPDTADAGAAQRQRHLQQLLVRRVNHLPHQAQQLLQVLALAGGTVPDAGLMATTGLAPAELAQARSALTRAQLEDVDGRLFDAVADAVALDLPDALRRRLHAQLAAALTEHDGAPERIAEHWWQSGQWRQAAGAAETAARHARALGLRRQEIEWLDRAAMAHDHQADAQGRWRAMAHAVVAACGIEPPDRLNRRLDQAQAAAPDEAGLLTVHLTRARAAVSDGDGATAIDPARQALTLARRLNDAPAIRTATGWLGFAMALQGEVAPALALMQQLPETDQTAPLADARAACSAPGARPESPHTDTPHRGDRSSQPQRELRARLDFDGALGCVYFQHGDTDAAARHFAQARQLALQLSDWREALDQTHNLLVALNQLGRTAEGRAECEQYLSLWRRLGEPDDPHVLASQPFVFDMLAGSGRLGEALYGLERLVRQFDKLKLISWRATSCHRLAYLYLRLGQPDKAMKALSHPVGDDPGRLATSARLQARVGHSLGRPVRQPLRQTLDALGDRLVPSDRCALMLTLAAFESPQEALNLARAVLADPRLSSDPPARRHAQIRMAVAEAELGLRAAAHDHLHQAWSDGPRAPALNIDCATFCHLAYQAAQGIGETELAHQALRAGVEFIESAQPNVPEPFARSYRERNPVHAALLNAARQLAAT